MVKINNIEYDEQLLPLQNFRDTNLKLVLRFGERCKLCNKLILKDTLKLTLNFLVYDKKLRSKSDTLNFCIKCSKTILKEFNKCKSWKREQQLKINAFTEILEHY